jgi:exodeoxyribonuclease V alpha subunit
VGEWKKHKSYGLQFLFRELTVLENELFYFLTRMVRGLGKNLAHHLIESMGGRKHSSTRSTTSRKSCLL